MTRQTKQHVISWRKKAVFATVMMVVFFLALEGALALLGLGSVNETRDPFIGFSSATPLFIKESTPGGDFVMATAPGKREWFNRQQFPKRKTDGTYRVFCLGGSTTYGRPYNDRTAFSGWLRQLLPAADRSRSWEVINAGGISYASYRVALLMEELVHYQPDLFIIYTGHNEFLERRTYGSILQTPRPMRSVLDQLNRLRTVSLLRSCFSPPEVDSGDRAEKEMLPADVDAILDRSIGPAAYHRDKTFSRNVVAHFNDSLRRMIRMARNVGAAVILIEPACNLRDCRPFKSEHRDGLTNSELSRWQREYAAARGAIKTGDNRAALTHLDAAAAIDDRFAELQYLRGRELLALKRIEEAKDAFIRARDEDVCPLRATTAITAAVAQTAKQLDTPCIDFQTMVAKTASDGIPGREQFFDHVHPRIAVHRRLALAIITSMIQSNIVRLDPDWNETTIDSIAKKVESQINRRDHAMALRNLAKVLGWAGKVEEADRLALEAAHILGTDPEAMTLAGDAQFRQGNLDAARQQYEHALALKPDDPEALMGLANVLQATGELNEAIDAFQRVIRIAPNEAVAHYNLANILFDLGHLQKAESEYREALRIVAQDANAHKNLGLVLLQQENTDEAIRELRLAAKYDPDSAERYLDLGMVLLNLHQPDQAERQFKTAESLAPTDSRVSFAFGLLAQSRADDPTARRHFEEALRRNPENADAHFCLGTTLVRLGETESARREFLTTLRIVPNHPEARARLNALNAASRPPANDNAQNSGSTAN